MLISHQDNLSSFSLPKLWEYHTAD